MTPTITSDRCALIEEEVVAPLKCRDSAMGKLAQKLRFLVIGMVHILSWKVDL
jgi:hypothetical protein